MGAQGIYGLILSPLFLDLASSGSLTERSQLPLDGRPSLLWKRPFPLVEVGVGVGGVSWLSV